MPFDAILLLAFGGPENMDEVRPFLANVLRGRPVPPQRLEAVVAHYALFNGRSPLKAITLRQADALRTALADAGLDLPVYVGMRNWHPYIHDILVRMAADGVGRALGVIMSAQHSEAGWQRYQHDVAAAQERLGSRAPQVDYLPGWHDHPLFIDALSDLTQRAFAAIPQDRRPPGRRPAGPCGLACGLPEPQRRSAHAVAGAGYRRGGAAAGGGERA